MNTHARQIAKRRNDAAFTDTMVKHLLTLNETSDCIAFTFRPGFNDWYKHADHDYSRLVRLFGAGVLASIRIYVVNPQHEDFIFWDNKTKLAEYLKETDSE